MDALIFVILIGVSIFLLRLGIVILFITRGIHKTRHKANDVHYTSEELYEIGSPFNSFNGFTNW
jgi:hypothetical protein